jgi:hypothetical protein
MRNIYQGRKILFAVLFTFTAKVISAQYPGFSIATDVSLQHNFKKDQRFNAVGHTTYANFHITKRDGAYISFAYYSNGKFNNDVTAVAKIPSTLPQQLGYTNKSNLRLRHFSLGWKRYFKGSPDIESGWNLYGYAGFGLMTGDITNTHTIVIDTALYNVPVISGIGKFKRLTIDAGIGWEHLLGGDLYFYSEGRVYIPTTDYPSKYLFINSKAPFAAMLGIGLRLLF